MDTEFITLVNGDRVVRASPSLFQSMKSLLLQKVDRHDYLKLPIGQDHRDLLRNAVLSNFYKNICFKSTLLKRLIDEIRDPTKLQKAVRGYTYSEARFPDFVLHVNDKMAMVDEESHKIPMDKCIAVCSDHVELYHTAWMQADPKSVPERPQIDFFYSDVIPKDSEAAREKLFLSEAFWRAVGYLGIPLTDFRDAVKDVNSPFHNPGDNLVVVNERLYNTNGLKMKMKDLHCDSYKLMQVVMYYGMRLRNDSVDLVKFHHSMMHLRCFGVYSPSSLIARMQESPSLGGEKTYHDYFEKYHGGFKLPVFPQQEFVQGVADGDPWEYANELPKEKFPKDTMHYLDVCAWVHKAFECSKPRVFGGRQDLSSVKSTPSPFRRDFESIVRLQAMVSPATCASSLPTPAAGSTPTGGDSWKNTKIPRKEGAQDVTSPPVAKPWVAPLDIEVEKKRRLYTWYLTRKLEMVHHLPTTARPVEKFKGLKFQRDVKVVPITQPLNDCYDQYLRLGACDAWMRSDVLRPLENIANDSSVSVDDFEYLALYKKYQMVERVLKDEHAKCKAYYGTTDAEKALSKNYEERCEDIVKRFYDDTEGFVKVSKDVLVTARKFVQKIQDKYVLQSKEIQETRDFYVVGRPEKPLIKQEWKLLIEMAKWERLLAKMHKRVEKLKKYADVFTYFFDRDFKDQHTRCENFEEFLDAFEELKKRVVSWLGQKDAAITKDINAAQIQEIETPGEIFGVLWKMTREFYLRLMLCNMGVVMSQNAGPQRNKTLILQYIDTEAAFVILHDRAEKAYNNLNEPTKKAKKDLYHSLMFWMDEFKNNIDRCGNTLKTRVHPALELRGINHFTESSLNETCAVDWVFHQVEGELKVLYKTMDNSAEDIFAEGLLLTTWDALIQKGLPGTRDADRNVIRARYGPEIASVPRAAPMPPTDPTPTTAPMPPTDPTPTAAPVTVVVPMPLAAPAPAPVVKISAGQTLPMDEDRNESMVQGGTLLMPEADFMEIDGPEVPWWWADYRREIEAHDRYRNGLEAQTIPTGDACLTGDEQIQNATMLKIFQRELAEHGLTPGKKYGDILKYTFDKEIWKEVPELAKLISGTCYGDKFVFRMSLWNKRWGINDFIAPMRKLCFDGMRALRELELDSECKLAPLSEKGQRELYKVFLEMCEILHPLKLVNDYFKDIQKKNLEKDGKIKKKHCFVLNNEHRFTLYFFFDRLADVLGVFLSSGVPEYLGRMPDKMRMNMFPSLFAKAIWGDVIYDRVPLNLLEFISSSDKMNWLFFALWPVFMEELVQWENSHGWFGDINAAIRAKPIEDKDNRKTMKALGKLREELGMQNGISFQYKTKRYVD